MVTREQDLLKPALAHGALRFIGATTLDGYRQYIEKDAALERRFQQILVSGPQLPPAPRRSKTCRSRETALHVHVRKHAASATGRGWILGMEQLRY